ncbi:MAG TPA: hypothetical protein VHL11_10695 [Phototrophicaceae bacterium]|jgi:hypothetical protein|nr:hypothetical protein [Phototrophicaceae bacterium]
MSIDCHIVRKVESGESLSTPVAAQQTYLQNWKKTGEQLGLKLVTQFEYLYITKNETVHQLIEELAVLKVYWETHLDLTSDSISRYMLRINSVTRILLEALEIWDEIDHISFG